MLMMRHLELSEGLFDLEPHNTYAERAVAIVAELGGAVGYKLSLGDGTELRQRAPNTDGFAIPLKQGNDHLGTLHLYASDGTGRLAEDNGRIARWAGRMFSRGLALSRRVAAQAKTDVDVKALLDGTPLTARERDVVGRLVSGASTRDISGATGLTISTVNTYMKRIFAKLGVHSRVELLARVTGTHASLRAAAVTD